MCCCGRVYGEMEEPLLCARDVEFGVGELDVMRAYASLPEAIQKRIES